MKSSLRSQKIINTVASIGITMYNKAKYNNQLIDVRFSYFIFFKKKNPFYLKDNKLPPLELTMIND